MNTISVGQQASPVEPVQASRVSSRAKGKTRIMGLLRVGVFLAAGASLGQVISTPDLGVISELHSRAYPAPRITQADEQVRWIQAPSSIMVEAGRTPEGGLDVKKMLAAWRDAGMDHWDARKAVDLVAKAVPMVTGHSDPAAEVLRLQEMKSAIQELEASFPQVVKRLQSGAASVQLDDDDALAWEGAILANGYRLAHDEDLETPPKGAISLDGQVEHFRQWNASFGEMLPEPYLVAFGNRADGSFSSAQMLDVLRRAGVNAHDAYLAVEYLSMLTGPLDNQPAMVFEDRREDIREFDERFMEQYLDTLDNLINAAQDPEFSVEDRSDPRMQEVWEEIANDFMRPPPPPAPAVSMEQARAMLGQAVKDVGLRSFTPSLWQMRSPQALATTAERLIQANRELSAATGWSGKVLGLNGRLELVMGSPAADLGAEAAVFGRLGDRILMVSPFHAMGHEWFHFYDHVVGRTALVYPDSRPMTENTQFFRTAHEVHVKSVFSSLNQALDKGSPQWHAHRKEADKGRSAPYFTRQTEAGAYAFAIFLNNNGAQVLNSGVSRRIYIEPERAPSNEEAIAHDPHFRAIFQATRSIVMGQEMMPAMKSIDVWRQARPVVVESPVQAPQQEPTRKCAP